MKKKLLGVGFCILLALLLLFGYNGYGVKPAPVFAFAQEEQENTEKFVYLTFDDGPTDSTTPHVLDVLKKEGVPATFFIIGKQAERRTYLLKRIVEEGHAIGIHTYSHCYKEIYASEQSLLNDIEKCSAVIEKAVGIRTDLYRFPGGSFTVPAAYLTAVRKAGLRFVDWNAYTRDGENIKASAHQLYRTAVETTGTQRYVILLMHDQAHRRQTVSALPDIIRFYREQGYRFGKL